MKTEYWVVKSNDFKNPVAIYGLVEYAVKFLEAWLEAYPEYASDCDIFKVTFENVTEEHDG